MADKPANGPQTAAELARALGVPRQRISAHRNKPNAPPIWDVGAWGIYLAALGRERSAPVRYLKQLAQKRTNLLGVRVDRERLWLAKEKRDVVAKSEIQFAIVQSVAVFFGALDQLVQEWAATLPGLSSVELANRVTGDIEAIKERLRSDFAELAAQEGNGHANGHTNGHLITNGAP